MIVTIILLTLSVIILVVGLYVYGKHQTQSMVESNRTRAASEEPPRWRHNDGKSLIEAF